MTMFSNALKSFTSNISSNYTISPQPTSFAGPWKIYDAKKKSTGKAASVFVFDKKSLEPPAGASFGGRSAASGLKRAHEEVVERLKKEGSSLARLRHPSVLEQHPLLGYCKKRTSKKRLAVLVGDGAAMSLKKQTDRSGGENSRSTSLRFRRGCFKWLKAWSFYTKALAWCTPT
jgi:hypothetical protein